MPQEEIYEMEEKLIDFLGAETVMKEVMMYLDSDKKAEMLDSIYRTYDLDIA